MAGGCSAFLHREGFATQKGSFGLEQRRAELPLLSRSVELAVLMPVARLKSSTLERDGRGFHITAEMVLE